MRLYPLPAGVNTGDVGLDRFLENSGQALAGEWLNEKADLDYIGCPEPSKGRISFYGTTLTLSLEWLGVTLGGQIKLPKIISNANQRYECYPSIVFISNGSTLSHFIAEGDSIILPALTGDRLILNTTMIIKAG